MRVQHQALVHGGVVQVQVVVGDAAVPVGAGRRAGDVAHRLQPERDGAASQHAGPQVVGRQRHGMGAVVGQRQRQRVSRVMEHHPLKPAAHPAAVDGIAGKGAQVAQRGAQPAFAPQQRMVATAGEHMQAQPGVGQDFLLAALEMLGQLVAEGLAHMAGQRRLAGAVLVVLGDVVLGQAGQRCVGVVQAGAGHAPRADGGAQQVHRLAGLWQPVSEEVTVERVQGQALGPARGGGNHPHVGRSQALFTQVLAGLRAGPDL